tara:strand:- start:10792 stop:11121 length:330 start_codon:yes stop_codon:yes gene_type:complete
MLSVLPATIVTPDVDRPTCDMKATAFVVWSKAAADAKANATEIQIVNMEIFLKKSRRLEDAVLLTGILKSLFSSARKKRLIVKRTPAAARSPRIYVDWNVRARPTILTI